MWGATHLPLTIRPPDSTGSGIGFGLSPSAAAVPRISPAAGDTDSEQPSSRGSAQAITPLSSQAPAVFTPPSQSHFDFTSANRSHFDRAARVDQAETPAQLAAAAALRRLMKSGEAAIPAQSPPLPRNPYLVPLQPLAAPAVPAVANPPTLESLLHTASRAVEQLHQAVRRRYRQPVPIVPASAPNGDLERHREHLAELERIEALVIDSMVEVAKSASTMGVGQGTPAVARAGNPRQGAPAGAGAGDPPTTS